MPTRSDHPHGMKLVILGRDGTINRYRDDHVKSPEELEPLPGALEAVARLNHAGWHTVLATNQPGIGRGLLDMASLNAVHLRLNQLLAEKGGRLDAAFFCPHTPEEGCDCRKPLPGEPPGKGPDGKVCTNVLISGCTEFGRHFEDYASCADVLTQRPYWPADPATETAANDPRLADKAYMAEVDWARKQLEASACVCCHTKKVSPGGKASNWYLDAPGIWLDGLNDSGVAIMAGLVSSKSLGAYPAKDNNGYDRTTLGAPTTDIPRMQKLLLGEWARRGLKPEDAAQYQAFGGPLESQMKYQPTACTGGEGVSASGAVTWSGGDARYVYVLEAKSTSPGVPPNLDQPAGTLWLVDVPTKAAPMKSGITYGKPAGAQVQRLPAAGAAAPKLTSGQSYYLYVLKDVGFPITRCLFKAP